MWLFLDRLAEFSNRRSSHNERQPHKGTGVIGEEGGSDYLADREIHGGDRFTLRRSGSHGWTTFDRETWRRRLILVGTTERTERNDEPRKSKRYQLGGNMIVTWMGVRNGPWGSWQTERLAYRALQQSSTLSALLLGIGNKSSRVGGVGGSRQCPLRKRLLYAEHTLGGGRNACKLRKPPKSKHFFYAWPPNTTLA